MFASDEHRSRVERWSRAQLALDEPCWSRRAAAAQKDELKNLNEKMRKNYLEQNDTKEQGQDE